MNTSCTFDELSLVEQETTIMLAEGLGTKEIAAIRYRSPRTVETQVKMIREKSETRNVAELISWYWITRYRLLPVLFLAIICTNLFFESPITRTRTTRTRVTSVRRREIYLDGFEIE
jgi:DNA-binding CsgD family transcriptional regulator